MERAVLLVEGNSLAPQDLHMSSSKSNDKPSSVSSNESKRNQDNSLPMMTVDQAEQKLIKQALELSHNNVPKAAIMLGLTKSSMYRRLEKYGIKY